MNVKTAFSTALLAAGLSATSYQSSAQTIPQGAVSSFDAIENSQLPSGHYRLSKPDLVVFEQYKEPGLLYTSTDSAGNEKSVAIMIPSRKKAAAIGGYNAILVPVSYIDAKEKSPPDFQEYAACMVADDKRAALTADILNNPPKLKEFVNHKGTITKVNLGISPLRMQQLLLQNAREKDRPIAKKPVLAFAVIGN